MIDLIEFLRKLNKLFAVLIGMYKRSHHYLYHFLHEIEYNESKERTKLGS